jgi:acetyl-CoA C-acetyltransferase
MIQTGFAEATLVGGVESMSNVPYLLPQARWGARMMDGQMVDALMHGLHAGSHFIKYPMDGPVDWARGKPYIMGLTAEFLQQKYGITRKEMDEVAVRSHNNVERCTKEGRFKEEIVGVAVPQKKGDAVIFDKDEHFRPGMNLATMEKLPPVFIPRGGTVTAGNASGMNDGASALVLMDAELAAKRGIKPIAMLTGVGMGGCAPEYMGESPVPAVHDLLKRTGRKSVLDYELVEVNEAFAAQYIAVEKQLGLDRSRTNVNGSGIGMGHPVGSTGARLLVTLIHEMIKQDKKVGMATLCGGGGVSMAVEVSR